MKHFLIGVGSSLAAVNLLLYLTVRHSLHGGGSAQLTLGFMGFGVLLMGLILRK